MFATGQNIHASSVLTYFTMFVISSTASVTTRAMLVTVRTMFVIVHVVFGTWRTKLVTVRALLVTERTSCSVRSIFFDSWVSNSRWRHRKFWKVQVAG